jgi:hypothetical protein
MPWPIPKAASGKSCASPDRGLFRGGLAALQRYVDWETARSL